MGLRGYCWHAYDVYKQHQLTTKEECKIFNQTAKPIDLNSWNNYRLWPNLMSPETLRTGETVFGFREAISIIWEHQHPSSCKDSKFLISGGFPHGFASVVHVEGSALAFAMETGRIYLPNPTGPVQVGHLDNRWQVRNPHCRSQNKNNMECYYEPWSSCTIEDAIGNMSSHDIPRIHDSDFKNLKSGVTENVIRKWIHSHNNTKTLFMIHTGSAYISKMTPKSIRPILDCSPIAKENEYYWWRAVYSSYFMRPNQPTLDLLAKYRTLDLLPNELCVAAYIRHGDKAIEMKLIPTGKYLEVAHMLWNSNYIPRVSQFHNKTKGNLFIGSEDPQVITDALHWGKKYSWKVVYTNLFDRSKITTRLDFQTQKSLRFASAMVHHDLEYLSIILNLEYAIKCDAWVCTLKSNFCRLIDELRATVGGKANRNYADLSIETCKRPPCIGRDIIHFDWR